MLKNGKNIACEGCKKQFYISVSRFGKKKFCSRECAFKYGGKWIGKEKKCVICSSKFLPVFARLASQKTCSYQCHVELAKRISKKSMAKRKTFPVNRVCKKCKQEFQGNALYKTEFCTASCYRAYLKKQREGKGNPNYSNGLWSKKGLYGKNNKVVWKHLAACRKYKEAFQKNHGCIFCEVCGEASSIQFSAHHIYYASRFPRHPNLHDFRNLILVCLNCHTKFHAEKYKDIFKKLEKERGLKELFGVN